MIRAFAIRPLAAAGLLLLAACAPTRDPNQAGFFSGIANMMTGAYETDTSALKSKAEASEQRVAALPGRERPPRPRVDHARQPGTRPARAPAEAQPEPDRQ